MATKDMILTFLAQGPRTTKYLMLVLSKSYAAVHTSLRRLSRAGKVFEDPARPNSWKTSPYPGQTAVPARVSKAKAFIAQAPIPAPPIPAPLPPPIPQPAAGTYAQLQKQAQPPTKKIRTEVMLVVDDSSSVRTYAQEMNESINRTISDLKADAYRTGTDISFSLYYFADSVRPQYPLNVNVKEVQKVAFRMPYGNTALFDAVERAINDHIRPERFDEEVAYLVITITDGEDNCSGDRSGTRMKNLLSRVQGTDRWTITFQMPPGKSGQFCRTYGIHPGNCTEWETTGQGLRETTVVRTMSTQNYMTNRTKGVTSMSTFYTDLSGVNVEDLKKNLTNIQDRVKTFPVAAEADIRPFIESKTLQPYEAGSVFYQLTKPELIQDTKKLLIKEKNGRAMFGGQEARKLLGLPQGEDCRVKPGNHGNFDLFVQSTSVNRKLVRGTTVVHWPLALQ